MPEGGSIELLDYQVPLKARRSDAGVGKIDIFGLNDSAIPVVIELKVLGKGTPDTPLRALLEGLAYAAIVEANESAFRSEISGITATDYHQRQARSPDRGTERLLGLLVEQVGCRRLGVRLQ